MIDVSSFLIERGRLRRFCLRGTRAIIVIHDVTGRALDDPRRSPAVAIAEWLLLALTVEAERFADPDDDCDDLTPSVFAVPRMPVRQRDVAAALDAHRGPAPLIVDYRTGELMWPLLAPHLVADTLQQIRLWDRALRQRRRIGGLVTSNAAAGNIAVAFDGSCVLRRSDGGKLDIGGDFWRAVSSEISQQRCVKLDQWQRGAFATRGNA